MTQICEYGCEQEAKFQFQNGKWCCSEKWYHCPVQYKLRIERLLAGRKLYSGAIYKELMEKKKLYNKMARKGKRQCKYCGETASYFIGFDRSNKDDSKIPVFCCEKKARQCPGFSKYLSRNHIMNQNNESKKEEWLKKLKAAQNRDEVKEKKQASMLHLHHSDCEKCKDFQANFTEAHKQRQGKPFKLTDREDK